MAPGTEPPADFSQSTLYFLPGVHTIRAIPECCSSPLTSESPTSQCRCDNHNTSAAGYVQPYYLRSHKNYYFPADAWVDGWLENWGEDGLPYGWGIASVKLFGYGVISGRKFQRRRCHPNNESPKGVSSLHSHHHNLTFVPDTQDFRWP